MPSDDQPRDELGRFTFSEGGNATNSGKDDSSGAAIRAAAGDAKPVVATGRKGEPIRVGDKALVKDATSRKPFEVEITGFDPVANQIRARRLQGGGSTIISPWEVLDKK